MGSFIKSTNFTNISYFGSYECLEKEPKRRFVAFLLHSVLINSGRTGWIFFSGECIAEEKSFASVLDAQFCSTHCNLCAAPAPQPVPCPTCAAARSPPSRELQNVEDIKIGKLDSLHKGTTKPALRAKKMTFHNSKFCHPRSQFWGPKLKTWFRQIMFYVIYPELWKLLKKMKIL